MWIASAEPDKLHPSCLSSIFWELGPGFAGDPALEKEAWLTRTQLTFGDCGFSALSPAPLATILFAPPHLLPGVAAMPSAPTPDATLISSLFASMFEPSLYAVLIDAALTHLLTRDISAVEAYARTAAAGREWKQRGLIPVAALEEAGFWLVAEHEETPRYRIELPPAERLLSMAEAEELVGVCC